MRQPPIAAKKSHSLTKHNHTRSDEYFWMRDREDSEVIAYLEAENAYTQEVLAPTKDLQAELFEEIKGRFVPDDSSVPYLLKDYWYYSRYESGKEYPIHCRKKGSLEAEEEIILDVNLLAEGKNYYQVAGLKLSKDHQLLAFGVDEVGRRIYDIHFKDLRTGEHLSTIIPATTGNTTWAENNETLFYSRQDPETLRSHRIFRHQLGSSPETDVMVYEEEDETFACYVGKTKSKKYLTIASHSTVSTEYRFLSAEQPIGDFQLIEARERDHEYSVDHLGDSWYVLTNWKATNFRLMQTPETATTRDHWEEVVAHRPQVLLEDMELFDEYLVLDERKDGLSHIQVIPWQQPDQSYYLIFDDETYLAGVNINPEPDRHVLRYSYQSMTTPNSTMEMDMRTQERTILKQQKVLGGFEVGNYQSERRFAHAEDGTLIPLSIVYRKDLRKAGPQALLLYAYGSYGHSLDPYFSNARLSLLDRGFVYVIAHIRGGSEMGRPWYEGGKLLHKQNTFRDFISSAEHLIAEGYTDAEQLFCQGGSAGGLLVGAVINQRPDLFHGAIAQVPFVDVVTTMLDEDIPLTTGEYDEWGNPNDPVFYHYMMSYSPYDNVTAQAYPHLLITSGLHDSQVQYWEPTKWAARLREVKTDDNRLLLHTNMKAGHSGTTGRFEPYKEVAMEYAFLLDLIGFLSPDRKS
ncbi:MAG: S9 family peptidase [Bacteroidota bacterium]